MSAASDYLEAAILNAVTGQATFPAVGFTWVSLHTSTPSEDTGSGEVTTAIWPSYTRSKAEGAGAVGSGWTAPANNGTIKESKNVNILPFSANNGANPVVLTSWALWNSASGGNPVIVKDFVTPVSVGVGEVFVFDVNSLTLTAA